MTLRLLRARSRPRAAPSKHPRHPLRDRRAGAERAAAVHHHELPHAFAEELPIQTRDPRENRPHAVRSARRPPLLARPPSARVAPELLPEPARGVARVRGELDRRQKLRALPAVTVREDEPRPAVFLRKNLAVAVRHREERVRALVDVHADGVPVRGSLEQAPPVRARGEQRGDRRERDASERQAARAPPGDAVPVARIEARPLRVRARGSELAQGHAPRALAAVAEPVEVHAEVLALAPRVVRGLVGTMAEVEDDPLLHEMLTGRDGRRRRRRARAVRGARALLIAV
eukprot:29312-Pelagococcus_subviridis.AAC.3